MSLYCICTREARSRPHRAYGQLERERVERQLQQYSFNHQDGGCQLMALPGERKSCCGGKWEGVPIPNVGWKGLE